MQVAYEERLSTGKPFNTKITPVTALSKGT
jgi:hypothetical protein